MNHARFRNSLLRHSAGTPPPPASDGKADSQSQKMVIECTVTGYGLPILLIKFLQLRSRLGWSLSRLVALLRQQLFVYRDLWRWIDHPFEGPPQPVAGTVEQLAISW